MQGAIYIFVTYKVLMKFMKILSHEYLEPYSTSGSKTQITIFLLPENLDKLYHQWWYFLEITLIVYWLRVKCIAATLYGISEWTRNCLQTCFYIQSDASRSLMLLLDGHLSHYTLELVKLRTSQI